MNDTQTELVPGEATVAPSFSLSEGTRGHSNASATPRRKRLGIRRFIVFVAVVLVTVAASLTGA